MRYATRLNSFTGKKKDLKTVLSEMAAVRGITHVDLNYPEHFVDMSIEELKVVLSDLGLTVNSVAMRFRKEFLHGEYTNRDEAVRREAIELSKAGIEATAALGCDLVTIWLGYDGWDYSFQKDYARAVDQTVAAYQELADFRPDIRLSIEYKPYEERVFCLNASVGTTLYLLQRIDRANVGATLDFAHMLMAGDTPAFGAAILLQQGKLWGVHLNDGQNRTDDGLMIGSVHPFETAEMLYYLLRYGYQGVIYFDTFPRRESASQEAAANVEMMDLLLAKLTSYGIDRITGVVDQADGVQAQYLRLALLG